MLGLTVLVVDGEEQRRTQLLLALRRFGVHALGVSSVEDTVLLLEALDAEITLVRCAAAGPELDRLREKSLVIELGAEALLEETVVSLLGMVGRRPEATAQLN